MSGSKFGVSLQSNSLTCSNIFNLINYSRQANNNIQTKVTNHSNIEGKTIIIAAY